MRIFISRPPGDKSGINVDDCASVSKKLTLDESFAGELPEEWVIEVSSPGINRKLSRPEHFVGAVGERVKLTVSSFDRQSGPGEIKGAKGRNTLRGLLVSFDGSRLELEDESLKEKVSVLLPNVHEARVDFQFK